MGRLSKNLEKKTKQKLILSVVGIIVLLFALLQFGLPALINLSIFLSGNKDDDTTTSTNNHTYIAPPVLNQTFTATKSASVTISGSGLEKQEIKLYVNDEVIDRETSKDDGSFIFKNVKLRKGNNTITTKAVGDNKKESDFSNSLSIAVIDKEPTLEIESPNNGETFPKERDTIDIKGKTDPGNRVTVNDFRVIVNDDGTFVYTVRLKGGENIFKIVVTDQAENKKEIERKVTYNS